MRDTIGYLILIAFLIGIFVFCWNTADYGYGYPGYKGYHNHRAYHMYYFGYYGNYDRPSTASNRETSTGGSRFSKKGISGGK